jgi:DNA-binding transcriptional LysR family regulator
MGIRKGEKVALGCCERTPDDLELVIRGALEGVGLAFVNEQEIVSEIEDGRLIRVLPDWSQLHPGFFILRF